MMEEYFDVSNLILRARSDFKNFEMKKSEKASTFADRFKTARLKADIKDDKDVAERLVDGLNEIWTSLLLNDPDYKSLRKKHKYGSEDVAKLLRNLQLDQDQIEKKRLKNRPEKEKMDKEKQPDKGKSYSKVAAAMASGGTSHQERLKKGICHLCNQPGHIRPNCPNLSDYLLKQQAKIAAQLQALQDTKAAPSPTVVSNSPIPVTNTAKTLGRVRKGVAVLVTGIKKLP